jgi:LPXTG-site transpeptidase (sortase) family protein
MNPTAQTHKHISFLDIIWHYKLNFAVYILIISCISFVGLYLFGGIPDELKAESTTEITDGGEIVQQHIQLKLRTNENTDNVRLPQAQVATAPKATKTSTKTATKTSTPTPSGTAPTPIGVLPTHITIDKIGVNVAITNPASYSNDVLNEYLLKGAVRYPGSGTLDKGNLFIFGHSSYLKVINNKAYKAFNGLKDLSLGDTIKIQSDSAVYIYKVSNVSLVDSDEGFVSLKTDQHMLTLATCNVFGEKQERYLVEAVFSGTESL